MEVHAGAAVHTLHFTHQVACGGIAPERSEEVPWIQCPRCQWCARRDRLPVLDQQLLTSGYGIGPLLAHRITDGVAWWGQIGVAVLFPRAHTNALHPRRLVLFDLNNTIDLADDRLVFRRSHLEQRFDTGQPQRDVPLRVGDPAAVERTHGELCPRLADAL